MVKGWGRLRLRLRLRPRTRTCQVCSHRSHLAKWQNAAVGTFWRCPWCGSGFTLPRWTNPVRRLWVELRWIYG
jgi:hypothetical protein